MRTCSVNGCDGKAVGRGWCQAHYRRWKTHGDVGADRPLQRYAATGCSVEGCDAPHHARGLCVAHHHRLIRYDDPLVVIGSGHGARPPKREPHERFWEKVDKHGPVPEYAPELGPCWLWTAYIQKTGYATFWVGGRSIGAHRYAYETSVGPIPKHLRDLDHLCRVTHCVRPDHLEPVTQAENVRRAGKAVTHCKRGHEYAEANTYRAPKTGKRSCRICIANASIRSATRTLEKLQ